MIETLQKLPDSVIGITFASALWFGFNYTILADRAMEQKIKQNIIPSCVKDLAYQENQNALLRLSPNVIPQTEGLNLQGLFRQFQNHFRLSSAQKVTICQCASKRTAQSAKFDYAVHTASLRIITPEAVNHMRDNTLSIVRSKVCDALPWSDLRK